MLTRFIVRNFNFFNWYQLSIWILHNMKFVILSNHVDHSTCSVPSADAWDFARGGVAQVSSLILLLYLFYCSFIALTFLFNSRRGQWARDLHKELVTFLGYFFFYLEAHASKLISKGYSFQQYKLLYPLAIWADAFDANYNLKWWFKCNFTPVQSPVVNGVNHGIPLVWLFNKSHLIAEIWANGRSVFNGI